MLNINLKKERFSIKNTFKCLGIIVAVVLTGFSMTACDKEDDIDKSITITNIDTDYNGKFAFITLESKTKTVAYGMGTVSSGSLTVDLLDWVTDEAWGKSGSYMVILLIYENAQAATEKNTLWEGGTTADKKFSEENTAVSFSQFIKVGPDPKQIKIVNNSEYNINSIKFYSSAGGTPNKTGTPEITASADDMPMAPGEILTFDVPAGKNWIVEFGHEGGPTLYPAESNKYFIVETDMAVITLTGDPISVSLSNL